MQESDEDRDRRVGVPRRYYLRLLAGAGGVGLAGCMGGGDGGNTTTEGGDGTGTTAGDGTDTTASTGGTGGTAGTPGTGTEGDTGTGTQGGNASTGGATPQGDPAADTVSIAVNNVPEQSNLNPWASTTRNSGIAYLQELTAPSLNTGEKFLSGHSWDTPWSEAYSSISIPTMFTDYRVEEPYDMYETHNQNLTYWDGETPLDAEARLKHEHVQFFMDGLGFAESETFNHEARDQWNYHHWRDKGEVEGQTEKPARKQVLESNAAPNAAAPMHPDFTTPYLQRFKDATSQGAADSIARELGGDTVTFSRFAEEEWGSGPYRVNPDDIAQDQLVATLREDHPNQKIAVPNLELRFAQPNRWQLLAQQGEIDFISGIVQENGTYTRDTLPDYVQELTQFLQPFGDQLLMNWKNEHLRNLWVRRAIVAAVDWPTVGANGWGDERSTPTTYHMGLSDDVAEQTFSEEFLDSLYQYPMEADPQQAAEWMQRAGYTRQGGTWTSPDGTPFEITLQLNSGIADYVGAIQTIAANLDATGLPADFQGMPYSAWSSQLDAESTDYSMTVAWAGTEEAWPYYYSQNGGAWYNMYMLGGDPTTSPTMDIIPSDYGQTDTHGKPLECQIPSEVGSIKAPDQAGKTPDLQNGTQISLPEVTSSLARPGVSDEEYQQALRTCARYYNYYVPAFMFHQYAWGQIGNVRNFNFAPEGHNSYRTGKSGVGGASYQTLGGLIQNKYDDSIPTPGSNG